MSQTQKPKLKQAVNLTLTLSIIGTAGFLLLPYYHEIGELDFTIKLFIGLAILAIGFALKWPPTPRKIWTAVQYEQQINYMIAHNLLHPKSAECEEYLQSLASLRHQERKVKEYYERYGNPQPAFTAPKIHQEYTVDQYKEVADEDSIIHPNTQPSF
jgi:hypothetical protein